MPIKAISTVIASILMLMIVIALGGTTYLYVSGIFTGKIATAFEIIDSVNDTVTIRNSGTDSITSFSSSTLDGNIVNIAVVPNIQDMVAYWSMNEGAGTITADNSGNKNVGNLKPSCPDCPAWTDGKYGNALGFDGVNDGVSIPPIDFSANGGTVSIWFNLRSEGSGRIPFNDANDNSDYIQVLSAGTIKLQTTTSGAVNFIVPAISFDTWYHLAVTRSDNKARVYLNGVESASGEQNFNGIFEIDQIGRYAAGQYPQFNWDGTIDEVSIYNRALSPEEIRTLYSGLVSPGQLVTVKPLALLTKGTHTLRLCTSSMCNTAILTIS